MGNKGIYNLFRIPYYWVWICVDGVVVRKMAIKATESIKSRVYVKQLKSVFMLPRLNSVVNPIKDGSGTLLVYDSRNAQALEPMAEEELQRELDKDAGFIEKLFRRKIKQTVTSVYFVPPPIDPKFLHTFLESHVAQDILAEPKPKYNDLIVIIVALGMVAAVIIAALYFTTHGNPIIVNATPMTAAYNVVTQYPTVIPTVIHTPVPTPVPALYYHP